MFACYVQALVQIAIILVTVPLALPTNTFLWPIQPASTLAQPAISRKASTVLLASLHATPAIAN